MQTAINLWLWRYKSSRKVYSGYHFFADAAACQLLLTHLADPNFRKLSLALGKVHPKMPLILAPAEVKYVGFDRLRLFKDAEAAEAMRSEEDGSSVDLYINGHDSLAEGLGYMLEGQWDFGLDLLSYWGLLSEGERRKRYGF